MWKLIGKTSMDMEDKLVGIEVYYNDIEKRFFVKLHAYNTVLKLSGNYHTIQRKIGELLEMLEYARDLIKDNKP